ncbi:MAG TPA: Fe-S protein assembly co-chaperone HscB [Candidatus Angelobacter sp.]|jgi:molecular chaperone HscB|nr:Fe-S protein assembly co-chaperone HscB [Candidatus Angelobacter sp.]
MTIDTSKTIAAAGTGDTTASCWSCGDMRAAHFCHACGKVQPPLPVNYFAFFALPRKLNLDAAALEREFYELSRKLHPDLNARADKREQEWSLEQSSLLNDAYRTLKDPIKRTQYLLRLEGVELEEQSKTATEKARASGEVKKQIVPPDLLEEVFELNMQLEELRMNQKMGEDDPALAKDLEGHKAQFEKKYEELAEELKTHWNRWDRAVGADDAAERRAALDSMVDLLNRRSYIRNLVRDVNEALGT